MRALVHEQNSGIEGLQIKEIQPPEIKGDEVKISIKYAGLNHRDLLTMEGRKVLNKPSYMGEDAAGVIK